MKPVDIGLQYAEARIEGGRRGWSIVAVFGRLDYGPPLRRLPRGASLPRFAAELIRKKQEARWDACAPHREPCDSG